MGAFWLSLLAGLAMLQYLRTLDRETTVLRNRFRLYALRDDLRECVMDGRISANNWVFQYLDSSIAKTIDFLGNLTLWTAVANVEKHRHDERLARASFHLENELKKTENECLSGVRDGYVESLMTFFKERHPTMELLSWNVFVVMVIGAVVLRKLRTLVVLQTESPETSTLEDFVPA